MSDVYVIKSINANSIFLIEWYTQYLPLLASWCSSSKTPSSEPALSQEATLAFYTE